MGYLVLITSLIIFEEFFSNEIYMIHSGTKSKKADTYEWYCSR